MQKADMMSTAKLKAHDDSVASDGHLLQFYSTDNYLTDAMAEFVNLGLTRGEAIIIAATAEHSRSMAAKLDGKVSNLQSYIESRQIVFANAHDCLEIVMSNGRPNREKFFELVLPLIKEAKTNYRRVRIFGELVNILCADDRFDAAMELEGYWNDLLAVDPHVMLMCGYDHANLNRQPNMYKAISEAHSDLIGDEAKTLSESVPALQQQAMAFKLDQRASLKRRLLHGENCLSIAQEMTDPLAIIKLSVDHLLGALEVGQSKGLSHEVLHRKLKTIESAALRLTKNLKCLAVHAKNESKETSDS